MPFVMLADLEKIENIWIILYERVQKKTLIFLHKEERYSTHKINENQFICTFWGGFFKVCVQVENKQSIETKNINLG